MANETEDTLTAWDARQYFVRELVYRAHVVLDSSDASPKVWYERLTDFYDFASCTITEKSALEIEALLSTVDNLINAKGIKNGPKYTEHERALRLQEAYQYMRLIFRLIQKHLYLASIYLPFKENINIIDRIQKQYL